MYTEAGPLVERFAMAKQQAERSHESDHPVRQLAEGFHALWMGWTDVVLAYRKVINPMIERNAATEDTKTHLESPAPADARDLRAVLNEYEELIDRCKALCRGISAHLGYGMQKPGLFETEAYQLLQELGNICGRVFATVADPDARFNAKGIHDMFMAHVKVRRPLPLRCIVTAQKLEAVALGSDRSSDTKRKRRRGDTSGRKATERQLEAFVMVQECDGNIAEAARRLGRDRKTVAEHYKKALERGCESIKRPKTRALPRDRRGQSAVAVEDDRRFK